MTKEAPTPLILRIEFDVTGLPEREINALIGEVVVQAEESDFVGDDGFGWTGHREVEVLLVTQKIRARALS